MGRERAGRPSSSLGRSSSWKVGSLERRTEIVAGQIPAVTVANPIESLARYEADAYHELINYTTNSEKLPKNLPAVI